MTRAVGESAGQLLDMTVEDDGPYKAEDNGGPSIYDIWDVYIHQFDRFFLEKVKSCLNVGPLLENSSSLLSFHSLTSHHLQQVEQL